MCQSREVMKESPSNVSAELNSNGQPEQSTASAVSDRTSAPVSKPEGSPNSGSIVSTINCQSSESNTSNVESKSSNKVLTDEESPSSRSLTNLEAKPGNSSVPHIWSESPDRTSKPDESLFDSSKVSTLGKKSSELDTPREYLSSVSSNKSPSSRSSTSNLLENPLSSRSSSSQSPSRRHSQDSRAEVSRSELTPEEEVESSSSRIQVYRSPSPSVSILDQPKGPLLSDITSSKGATMSIALTDKQCAPVAGGLPSNQSKDSTLEESLDNLMDSSHDTSNLSPSSSPPPTSRRPSKKFKKAEKPKADSSRTVELDPTLETKETISPKSKKSRTKSKKTTDQILRGVVFTISGFVNPERGELRRLGLEMGAKYRPTLTDDVTHIISQFESTPKIKAASNKGIKVVEQEWLHACKRRKRKVSEKNYRMDGVISDDEDDDTDDRDLEGFVVSDSSVEFDKDYSPSEEEEEEEEKLETEFLRELLKEKLANARARAAGLPSTSGLSASDLGEFEEEFVKSDKKIKSKSKSKSKSKTKTNRSSFRSPDTESNSSSTSEDED